MTDEQINALWKKWVGTGRPNYSFARAIESVVIGEPKPSPVCHFCKGEGINPGPGSMTSCPVCEGRA